jgi:hypothetical protein
LSVIQILALDLLKARVSVMPVDTRKTFIGTVLVGLIEKTTDAKVSSPQNEYFFVLFILYFSPNYLGLAVCYVFRLD